MMINPDSTIEEIINSHPYLVKVLEELKISCVVCGEPVWGTLRDKVTEVGADIEEVLTILNDSLRRSEK